MLKVNTPIRVLTFLGSVIFCFAVAHAQSGDWHLSTNGAKVFFIRSAFAHGYMHGYEEGFHNGDLDLQMARPFHPVKDQTRFKKICGYRGEFGDRKTFDEGYRKGYAVGYTDSYAGRNFRAMQLVSEAKLQEPPGTPATPDPQFDRAFIAGYESGQKVGLEDGRAATAVAALDSIDCGSIAGADGKNKSDDCSAYRRGYRLGYSDGYTNQHESGAVFARK